MKILKRFYIAIFSAAILFCIASCKNPFLPSVNPDDSENTENNESDKDDENNSGGASESYYTLLEDFEGASINSKYKWTGDATFTSASELGAGKYEFESVQGKFAMLDSKIRGDAELSLKNIVLEQQSALSFKYLPTICNKVKFSVLVDGKEKSLSYSINFFENCWIPETVIIPEGKHSITFKVSNPEGWYIENYYNAIFIDDVSIVPDVVTGVKVTPRSKQQTYIGCKNYEKIVAKGYAVRSDGSVKPDAKVTLSATCGTIDKNGVFTPTEAGAAKITATCGDFTADSGEITVYDSYYMQQPFTYNGKVYKGIVAGTESGEVNPETIANASGEITISYPSCSTFDADGFFTLEGTVNDPDVYNYAFVNVWKGEPDSSALQTSYLVRDNFSTRIWLRFGKGEYTVIVYNIGEILLSENLGAEGDYRGFGGGYGVQVFNVTNTRSESFAGEKDARWIYPSDVVQSDNVLVSNTASEILYDLPSNATDTQKIKAIHDYIVRTKYYDYVSIDNENRKKQDAVSVLRYGTCVCEGYANLLAAMARYAGIPAKFVGDTAGGPHGWNNVYIGDKWLFLDATWDDPSLTGDKTDFDPQPYRVNYDYFLLEKMGGINDDHTEYSAYDGRSAESVSAIPQWRGTPGGWY